MQMPQSDDMNESYESFISDTYMTPENELERQHIWESILQGLDELPMEQREVFIKNELEGIPFRQIADETGVNINTLLARKRYAVLHLRKKLQTHYDYLAS
jgi:RNA polymerase sigma factor (sigma-70 family)